MPARVGKESHTHHSDSKFQDWEPKPISCEAFCLPSSTQLLPMDGASGDDGLRPGDDMERLVGSTEIPHIGLVELTKDRDGDDRSWTLRHRWTEETTVVRGSPN